MSNSGTCRPTVTVSRDSEENNVEHIRICRICVGVHGWLIGCNMTSVHNAIFMIVCRRSQDNYPTSIVAVQGNWSYFFSLCGHAGVGLIIGCHGCRI